MSETAVRTIDLVIAARIQDETDILGSRDGNYVIHAEQAPNSPWTARITYPDYAKLLPERPMAAWQLAAYTPLFEALTGHPSGIPGVMKPAPDQIGRWDPRDDPVPASSRRRKRVAAAATPDRS